MRASQRPVRRPALGGQDPRPGKGGLRFAGVAIRFTGGAGLLAVLAAVLSAISLPDYAAGRPAWAYLAAAAVIAVQLLGSLTLHEFGHIVAGRRYGTTPDELVIGFAGGAEHGGAALPDSRARWRAAASGPLASLAAAALTGAGAAALAALGADRLVLLVLAATAAINAVIGILSLVPGAGPDGGRIIGALAQARTGDAARAGVIAARTGQWAGAALAIAGGALVASGLVAGLWVAVIGILAFTSSRAEARRQLITAALAGLRVRDIVPLNPGPDGAVPSWQTVAAFVAARKAGSAAAGPAAAAAFPLRGFGGEAAGLLTVSQLAAVPTDRQDSVRLREIATPQEHVVTTTADEELTSLAGRLSGWPGVRAAAHTVGYALVLDDDGSPAGVLTRADLNRACQLGWLRTAGQRAAARSAAAR